MKPKMGQVNSNTRAHTHILLAHIHTNTHIHTNAHTCAVLEPKASSNWATRPSYERFVVANVSRRPSMHRSCKCAVTIMVKKICMPMYTNVPKKRARGRNKRVTQTINAPILHLCICSRKWCVSDPLFLDVMVENVPRRPSMQWREHHFAFKSSTNRNTWVRYGCWCAKMLRLSKCVWLIWKLEEEEVTGRLCITALVLGVKCVV